MFAIVCVWNFDCVLASVSQLSCTTAPLRRLRLARNRAQAPPEERALQHQRRETTALSGASNFLFGWLKQPLIHTTPKGYRSSRVGQRSIRWKSKKRKANQRFANQAFARCNPEAGMQPERCYETEEKLIRKKFILNSNWIQINFFQIIFPLLHEYTFFDTRVLHSILMCGIRQRHHRNKASETF